MNRVKFRKFVPPGIEIRLETKLEALRDEMAAVQVRARVGKRYMRRLSRFSYLMQSHWPIRGRVKTWSRLSGQNWFDFGPIIRGIFRMGIRVVITGLGMITPLGRDVEETGRDSWTPRVRWDPYDFDAAQFPVRFAAQCRILALPVEPGDGRQFKGPIDPCRLFGGVGPIPVTRGSEWESVWVRGLASAIGNGRSTSSR